METNPDDLVPAVPPLSPQPHLSTKWTQTMPSGCAFLLLEMTVAWVWVHR